jgi:hypothetical protein
MDSSAIDRSVPLRVYRNGRVLELSVTPVELRT